MSNDGGRWVCPGWRRQFGRRNQTHVCAPSMSVDEFFHARPDGDREVFDAVLARLDDLGEVYVEPVSVGILLKRVRTFAELRPRKGHLALWIMLGRPLDGSRIVRRLRPSANRYASVIELPDVGAVDDELAAWLAEAYFSSPE